MVRNRNPAKRLTQHRLLHDARGVTAIGRHSFKEKTPSGLSKEGIRKAIWSGRHLPVGFKLHARAGELPRQQSTAKVMLWSYRGKKRRGVEEALKLGYMWFKNPSHIDELIEKNGGGKQGDAKVLQMWMDGKIPARIAENPRTAGESILRDAIANTEQLARTSQERPFVLNLTSSWFDAAILKALNIDYRNIRPKKQRNLRRLAGREVEQGDTFRETEAMLFFHLPDNRIILSWRGKKMDVTRQLRKILK